MTAELATIEVQPVVEQAKGLTVQSHDDNRQAGALLIDIKTLRKKIDANYDPVISKAHEAHKAAVSAKKEHTGPLDAAEAIIKSKVSAFLAAEDARRLAEQRRLEAEARQVAEAERARQAAEAKAAADAAKAERERAIAAGNAEAAKTAEAARKLAAALAREIKAAPVIVAPVIMADAPVVAGQTRRKVWRHRIVNEALVPREYLLVDETKIRKVITALGGACQIPGIEVFEESSIAVRI